ncbi:TetR/AcrR family transcriptional regulator C-terminal domain-containing protein [Mycobacterium sp.]|uniref:TetR/AcrR family transcriptional regulator C-terminal domain-containing protein n=1 Tax=Mycobacterium sp. TaxID=1785 RepID=UPI00120E36EA|nr:TetR/AcrR family transcriptional regulator C-terminal domain-containing protein [Mycobacterium sp.]TAM70236.1 MAG: TetR/AcrR family transcriptional regulator [Mycobacterium sp.]
MLDAGLQLVDDEGLAALTIRRLASDLDVGTMTIYSYVRDKDDLLDGITQRALRTLTIPSPGPDWEPRLSRAIGELYRVLRQHPGATQILADGLVPGPTLDPAREGLLAILRIAGFAPGDATRHLNALFGFALGFAAVAGHHPEPSSEEQARIAALPADRYPYLVESATAFAARFSQASFDSGLQLLLTGLRSALPAHQDC